MRRRIKQPQISSYSTVLAVVAAFWSDSRVSTFRYLLAAQKCADEIVAKGQDICRPNVRHNNGNTSTCFADKQNIGKGIEMVGSLKGHIICATAETGCFSMHI